MIIESRPTILRPLPLPGGHRGIRVSFTLDAEPSEGWLAVLVYAPDPGNDSDGKLLLSGYGVLMTTATTDNNIAIVDRPLIYPSRVFDDTIAEFGGDSAPYYFDGSGYRTYLARGGTDLSGSHQVEITIAEDHAVSITVDGTPVLTGPSYQPVNAAEIPGKKPGYSLSPSHYNHIAIGVISDHAAQFQYRISNLQIHSTRETTPGLILDFVLDEMPTSAMSLSIQSGNPEVDLRVQALVFDRDTLDFLRTHDIGTVSGAGVLGVPTHSDGDPIAFAVGDQYHIVFLVTTDTPGQDASIGYARLVSGHTGTRVGGKYSIWVRHYQLREVTYPVSGGSLVLDETNAEGAFMTVQEINGALGWQPALGHYSVRFTPSLRGSIYDRIQLVFSADVTGARVLFSDIRSLQQGALEHSDIGEVPVVRILFPVNIWVNVAGDDRIEENIDTIVQDLNRRIATRRSSGATVTLQEILGVIRQYGEVDPIQSSMDYEYHTDTQVIFHRSATSVSLPSSRYAFVIARITLNGERIYP